MSVIAISDCKGFKPTTTKVTFLEVGDYIVKGQYYQEIIQIGKSSHQGRLNIISTCNEQGGVNSDNMDEFSDVEIKGVTLSGLMKIL